MGFAGALVLGGAGVWLSPPVTRGIRRNGTITDADKAILRTIASAVLTGSLPSGEVTREAELAAVVARIDTIISGLPPSTRNEISSLLKLLTNPLGRYAMTGLQRPWAEASSAELRQALQTMRTSSFELPQQAYHALRDLTNAAFYAGPNAWPLIGYPGPLRL